MAPVRILEGFLVGFHLLFLGHFLDGLGIWRILRWLRFRFLFVSHDATTLRLPLRPRKSEFPRQAAHWSDAGVIGKRRLQLAPIRALQNPTAPFRNLAHETHPFVPDSSLVLARPAGG